MGVNVPTKRLQERIGFDPITWMDDLGSGTDHRTHFPIHQATAKRSKPSPSSPPWPRSPISKAIKLESTQQLASTFGKLTSVCSTILQPKKLGLIIAMQGQHLQKDTALKGDRHRWTMAQKYLLPKLVGLNRHDEFERII